MLRSDVHMMKEGHQLMDTATVCVIATASILAAATDHTVSNPRALITLKSELTDALHNPTSLIVHRA